MKQSEYNYCHVAQRTDVGLRRQANEDWLTNFECDNGKVALVCDGMGGHVGGQVASHVAVEAAQELLTGRWFDSPEEAITAAADCANRAILDRADEEPGLRGMGATFVMALLREGRVWVGWVGDSRAYLIRRRTIRQLTVDQSYVQSLVDAGEITREEAERHPRKNEITNALGLDDMRPAMIVGPFEPEPGDCFLLCSDGLSGMVSDAEIERVVSKQTEMSQQERVDALVQMARDNGGVDNITVQIMEFASLPTVKVDSNRRWIKPAIAALCLLAAALFVLLPCGDAEEDKSVADEPTEVPTGSTNGPADKPSGNATTLPEPVLSEPGSSEPAPADGGKTAADKKKKTATAKKKKNSAKQKPTMEVIEDNTDRAGGDNASAGKEPEIYKPTVKIKRNVQNQKIHIHSCEGTNTDTMIYVKDVALQSGEGDCGWYSWECKLGSECIITVKNGSGAAAFPQQKSAVINVPVLKNQTPVRLIVKLVD